MAAANPHLPMTVLIVALRVDCQNYRLRAEFSCELEDELRTLHRRRVDGDFVCPRSDHSARVFECANTAARRERDGKLSRDAANRLKKCRTSIARRRNVEHDEFVRTFGVVARGKRDGIAGVAQPNKVDAFDHANAVRIEAGNNAMRQAHAPAFAMPRKLARSCAPGCPLFSGWN